jgi:hypothetical protein
MRLNCKAERDANLLRAYEETRREKTGYAGVAELAGEAVCRKADSFWLSERRYLDIIKGRKGLPKSGMKRAMHEDIRKAAARLRRARPEMTAGELAAALAAEEAPRFYLSEKRATDIVYGAIKGRGKARGADRRLQDRKRR